jgi:aryl-alcohol dehydrogenase-like predicted oxidoreductase
MMETAQAMPMRPLGRTGLQVSAIALGALELGRDWAADVNPGGGHAHGSQEEATRLVDGALELGLNLIDTAAAYWRSEEYLGHALKGRRDQVILATKFGETWSPDGGSVYDYSAAGIRATVENSLRLLQTDRLDLLQIHSAKPDLLEAGEVLATMETLRSEGKVRFLGYSADVETALIGVRLGGFDVVQVPYSILNPMAAQSLFAEAEESGVGVLLMRTLAGGKLTSKYRNLENQVLRDGIEALLEFTEPEGNPDALGDLAVSYALTPTAVSAVLLGTRRAEAVATARTAAARGPLSPDLVQRIDQKVRELGLQAW